MPSNTWIFPVASVRFVLFLVVFLAVADEILQCETVMNGDEIDARPRSPAAISENIRRTGHPGSEIGDETLVTSPEAPDGVPILPVPLGPAGRKIAELISVRAEIPRFGNQFEPGHHRILSDRIEECTALAIIAVFAGEARAQIEAETVDMHLQCPVTQRVHDQLQHPRMIEVHCVAGAGHVVIKSPVGFQTVIGSVVDAAKRQCRAELVALTAVVVDDIENDLDPGIVQALYRCLEAGDRWRR